MIRQLIAFAVVLSFGAALLSNPLAVNACGEKAPETLLSLYKTSDSIYIATFDRTDELGIAEDEEYYTMMKVQHNFSISSTLKGDPQKFVSISESEYRSKDVETAETETVEEEEHYDDGELKSGDKIILFVKKRSEEEGGGFVYTDYVDGIKKLEATEMAVYERRINELNNMFAEGKPDNQIVVDWLISLLEDPITRWEGAYELLTSAQTNDWRAEHEASVKKKKENGEELEEWENEISAGFEDPKHELYDKLPYSKLLTEQHKALITKLVIERVKEPANDDEKETEHEYNPRNGDAALLELAIRWGDGRLAGHLLGELRTGTDSWYEKYELMDKISAIVKDQQVTTVKEMFSRIYWQEEQDVAKLSDIKGIYDENGMLNIHLYNTPAYEELEELELKERSGEIVSKSKKTYREIRAELIAEFISKSELILTTNGR